MATSIVFAKLNEVLDWCDAGQGALFAASAHDRAQLWPALDRVREDALCERALWADGAIDACLCWHRLDALLASAERLAGAANVASEAAIY